MTKNKLLCSIDSKFVAMSLAGAALLVAGAALPSRSLANTISPAISYTAVSTGNLFGHPPAGEIDIDNGTGVPVSSSVTTPELSASAFAATIFQPFPQIFGSASVDGYGLADAQARLTYWFEVVGPESTDPVPVIIMASGAVTPPDFHVGPNYVQLSLDSTLSTPPLGSACLSAFGGCGTLDNVASFSIATTLTFLANSQHFLYLQMVVMAYADGGSNSASGYLDPILIIDPSFARASEYHLEFSPGIGNSVVPLPATLPLFATGAGLIGLLGWRRKKRMAKTVT